jgi:uncharacterized protein
MRITFANLDLQLLADRAMLWRDRRALVIADWHLGKASVFRARGVPVPTGTSARDYARLDALLDSTDATRIIVLGDLLHARESENSLDALRAWRDRRPALRLEVVPGNHDRHVGADALDRVVTRLDALHEESGVLWTHQPIDDAPLPVVAGHVHPVAQLTDFDGSGVRVPCFAAGARQLILPSFGSFTGGSVMRAEPGQTLYACAAGRVVEIR